MKIKIIMQWITLTALSIYLIYCSLHFIVNKIEPTYSDCGKVVSKSNDEAVIKYGTRTILYLNVQFENRGFQSIECNPTTYFSKRIGDRVCFNLPKHMGIWYAINWIIGGTTVIMMGLIILNLIIFYLIPDSWFE